MEFVMIFSRNKSKLDNGIIINVVPYQLLLRWVIGKKKVWSRSFIWQEALVSPSTNKQYPTPNSLYLDNDI